MKKVLYSLDSNQTILLIIYNKTYSHLFKSRAILSSLQVMCLPKFQQKSKSQTNDKHESYLFSEMVSLMHLNFTDTENILMYHKMFQSIINRNASKTAERNDILALTGAGKIDQRFLTSGLSG